MLGSGAFASSYTPKIGEDVVTGRQDSSTRNVPNYTGTIESGDFDIFENRSKPDFSREPRSLLLGTRGFASSNPFARASSIGRGFGGSSGGSFDLRRAFSAPSVFDAQGFNTSYLDDELKKAIVQR